MPKVLIVDDKEENRKVLKNFFRLFGTSSKSGIQLFEASSGKEAVNMAGNDVFDLIFMDINMETPEAGLDATKLIREIPESNNTLIWAITAQAMESHGSVEGDREKCLKAGCNDHIPKPFDSIDLLKKTSEALKVDIPAKTKLKMGLE
jgi:CheY-like chemotaxis protein